MSLATISTANDFWYLSFMLQNEENHINRKLKKIKVLVHDSFKRLVTDYIIDEDTCASFAEISKCIINNTNYPVVPKGIDLD